MEAAEGGVAKSALTVRTVKHGTAPNQPLFIPINYISDPTDQPKESHLYTYIKNNNHDTVPVIPGSLRARREMYLTARDRHRARARVH